MPEVKSMQTEDVKSGTSVEAGKGSTGKGSQDELMTEVTSLLKAIRLDQAQMKVCQIKKVMPEDEMRTLIDGGATHCLSHYFHNSAKRLDEYESTCDVFTHVSEKLPATLHAKVKTVV